VLLEGFSEGVLPGVSLLSRCLLSGSPVESAFLFGPGLMLINQIFKPILNIKGLTINTPKCVIFFSKRGNSNLELT
jgi:hypothetical protein